MITQLPPELQEEIILFLDPHDLLVFRQISHQCYDLLTLSGSLWKRKLLEDGGDYPVPFLDDKNMLVTYFYGLLRTSRKVLPEFIGMLNPILLLERSLETRNYSMITHLWKIIGDKSNINLIPIGIFDDPVDHGVTNLSNDLCNFALLHRDLPLFDHVYSLVDPKALTRNTYGYMYSLGRHLDNQRLITLAKESGVTSNEHGMAVMTEDIFRDFCDDELGTSILSQADLSRLYMPFRHLLPNGSPVFSCLYKQHSFLKDEMTGASTGDYDQDRASDVAMLIGAIVGRNVDLIRIFEEALTRKASEYLAKHDLKGLVFYLEVMGIKVTISSERDEITSEPS